jgi:hypothetical protein
MGLVLRFIMRGKSVHTVPSGPIQIGAKTFAANAASLRWSLPCTARAVLNNLRRWWRHSQTSRS